MFIDSVLRGYSIPAFYFHKKQTSAAGFTNTLYEIVDGQQRIDAIHSYSEGAFPLLSKFKFPNFVQHADMPWDGKRFTELLDTEKKRLQSQVVVIYEITTSDDNEVRDLFIRLQAGTPLNSQDKRDSWPGEFTNFVLTVGGKKDVPKWYGWPFFKNIAKVSNESRRRQLVAQSFMLFWMQRREVKFVDIKSSTLDDFYCHQVGFDQSSDEAVRFKEVCDVLNKSFLDSKKPFLLGHYVIHLVLLIDSLLDEYVRTQWTHNIVRSLKKFGERLKDATDATRQGRSSEYQEYYKEYGQWINNQSDNANSIRRRHAFFAKEMLDLIGPERRDQGTTFTRLQRKIVFFRDYEVCQFCKMIRDEDQIVEDKRVDWADCVIYQVTPDDGQTQLSSMENAALMHLGCCPADDHNVERFRNWWHSTRDPVSPRLNDLKDAIYYVLLSARNPLHYREIAKRIKETDVYPLRGLTPENTVLARIRESIGSRFRQVDPGMYEAIPRAGRDR